MNEDLQQKEIELASFEDLATSKVEVVTTEQFVVVVWFLSLDLTFACGQLKLFDEFPEQNLHAVMY